MSSGWSGRNAAVVRMFVGGLFLGGAATEATIQVPVPLRYRR
jgi:hypothetical protein